MHFDLLVYRLFVQLSSARRESGSSKGVGVDRGGGGDSSPADVSSRMPLIVISSDAPDRHSKGALLGRPSGASSSADRGRLRAASSSSEIDDRRASSVTTESTDLPPSPRPDTGRSGSSPGAARGMRWEETAGGWVFGSLKDDQGQRRPRTISGTEDLELCDPGT